MNIYLISWCEQNTNAYKEGQVIITQVVPALQGSCPARIWFKNIQILVLNFLPYAAPKGNQGSFNILILSL